MHSTAPNSEEYLEAVKKTPHMTPEELKDFTLQYCDVYFHPVSPKHKILFRGMILRSCLSKLVIFTPC